ncbi:hypothetical protein BY996DRAFT_7238360 [Phakopsora pachyrhizi]|nr:hypothetical protein BY996DRAFT_7464582 [Phakopsora pachyrhizi]KAI8452251.1 hypothetical protein BY996DRAFT_7238360 [Phakopsora pachyrhizi]
MLMRSSSGLPIIGFMVLCVILLIRDVTSMNYTTLNGFDETIQDDMILMLSAMNQLEEERLGSTKTNKLKLEKNLSIGKGQINLQSIDNNNKPSKDLPRRGIDSGIQCLSDRSNGWHCEWDLFSSF